MKKEEYKALIHALMMLDDPEQLIADHIVILKLYANRVAKTYGFGDWIEAYHNM